MNPETVYSLPGNLHGQNTAETQSWQGAGSATEWTLPRHLVVNRSKCSLWSGFSALKCSGQFARLQCSCAVKLPGKGGSGHWRRASSCSCSRLAHHSTHAQAPGRSDSHTLPLCVWGLLQCGDGCAVWVAVAFLLCLLIFWYFAEGAACLMRSEDFPSVL